MLNKKILIVGTVPYNKKSTSRAFDAYFHFFEKENLAQIFSNAKAPCKGHCGTLFQITDSRVLSRWLGKKIDTGVIYNYDDLEDDWQDWNLEFESGSRKKLYKIASSHTPLSHILRGILWRKKFWCTDKLNAWLDGFAPDCVFLAFSDDYFIPRIAMYVAKRYNIPIVSCVGDDYYFNGKFSLNPFYHIYKSTYRRLVRKVFSHRGSAIYISDKIRDKYNSEFSLDGQTVYLASTVKRKPFAPINKEKPVITYFGNIGIGRNNSLDDIGYAIGEINKDWRLEVYSNEPNEKVYRVLKDNPYIDYKGSVPYAEVEKRIAESDITVIVEGFRKKDIDKSRYSLSTKAADALSSGAAIFVYGSTESGIIDYMKSTGAATVCESKDNLKESILKLINDADLQKEYYSKAIEITEKNHNLKASCRVSEEVFSRAIGKI